LNDTRVGNDCIGVSCGIPQVNPTQVDESRS